MAKKEQSKIMAVRRAIFVLPGHAEEVQAAIKEAKPHRILILGTSENMVFKIAKALHLPQIAKIIHIEDVATKQEMAQAQFHRLKEGKHIIPVPTIELKPHFSGYLVDPLQTLFKRSSTKRRRLGEKPVGGRRIVVGIVPAEREPAENAFRRGGGAHGRHGEDVEAQRIFLELSRRNGSRWWL